MCIVYVRSKKTVKKTVRSNCNPDLLSASFGPSQRLRISVHHIPSYAHTSIHALPNRTISSSLEHTECVVSSPFPPPNFLVLEPFPPDSLLRSHPLLASENRGPHSGRQGIELPSPCFSIQLEKRARQEWWAFRRLSPTFPKTTQGTGHPEEAGKETFLFLSSKENCCEGTVFVKSGHARVEKALGKENGQGE